MTYEQRVELYTIQSCLAVGMATGDSDIIYEWNERLIAYHERYPYANKHEYNQVLMQVQDYFKRGLDEKEADEIYNICIRKIM